MFTRVKVVLNQHVWTQVAFLLWGEVEVEKYLTSWVIAEIFYIYWRGCGCHWLEVHWINIKDEQLCMKHVCCQIKCLYFWSHNNAIVMFYVLIVQLWTFEAPSLNAIKPYSIFRCFSIYNCIYVFITTLYASPPKPFSHCNLV